MISIVEKARRLPEGVRGNILTFIPRNETAQLMIDANNKDMLLLRYLHYNKVKEGNYKNELFNKLAPSIIGSTQYGDESSLLNIIRTKISIGENIRLAYLSKSSKIYEIDKD